MRALFTRQALSYRLGGGIETHRPSHELGHCGREGDAAAFSDRHRHVAGQIQKGEAKEGYACRALVGLPLSAQDGLGFSPVECQRDNARLVHQAHPVEAIEANGGSVWQVPLPPPDLGPLARSLCRFLLRELTWHALRPMSLIGPGELHQGPGRLPLATFIAVVGARRDSEEHAPLLDLAHATEEHQLLGLGIERGFCWLLSHRQEVCPMGVVKVKRFSIDCPMGSQV